MRPVGEKTCAIYFQRFSFTTAGGRAVKGYLANPGDSIKLSHLPSFVQSAKFSAVTLD